MSFPALTDGGALGRVAAQTGQLSYGMQLITRKLTA